MPIIGNNKTYTTVIEYIKKLIIDEKLTTGDKLPPERILADKLKVSRSSVREAIRTLEILGVIETRQRSGNYIVGNFKKTLSESLSVMFLLQKLEPTDVKQVRRAIEVEAVQLCIGNMTDNEIMDLKNIFIQFSQATDKIESIELDKEFHFTIANGTKNYMIITILNVLSNIIDLNIENTQAEIMGDPECKQALINLHKNILDAILEKDPEKAAKAMKEHFM